VQRLAPTPAHILANTSDAVCSLVASGAGFAVLPSRLAHTEMRAGRIVRVLPDWRGRTIRLHICLPSKKHAPARVTLFLNELRLLFNSFFEV
jgi:DNA-binding transcriptional LysR family regulator